MIIVILLLTWFQTLGWDFQIFTAALVPLVIILHGTMLSEFVLFIIVCCNIGQSFFLSFQYYFKFNCLHLFLLIISLCVIINEFSCTVLAIQTSFSFTIYSLLIFIFTFVEHAFNLPQNQFLFGTFFPPYSSSCTIISSPTTPPL